MEIEKSARKYITDAIELEEQLQVLEKKLLEEDKFVSSFQSEINEVKKKFIIQIGKINSVANIERHGRDDLDFTILQSSDEVFTNISECESESLRILAGNVKKSFENMRKILRKYAKNIEIVDPQLRNNHDLVKVLNAYESYWEKGKNYFLDKEKCYRLIFFSNVLEGLSEK